jgi:hypothetical protein
VAGGVRTLDRRAYGRPGAPAREGRARDEQILPDREQRDLDAVPSFLALRGDEAAGPSGSVPAGQLSRNSSNVRPSASHSASS